MSTTLTATTATGDPGDTRPMPAAKPGPTPPAPPAPPAPPPPPATPTPPEPPRERDERPDGRALVDRLIVSPSCYEYRGHTAHDRVIVLDHALAGDHGGLGYLVVATLSGEHYGAHPGASSGYRRDVVIQDIRAHRAPISLSLSWDAARHLCAALRAWEEEHPATERTEESPAPDPDDLPF